MDLPEVEHAMRGLRAAGHDVTVLHVMDPAERELPSSGEALFVDTETDLSVPASVADVRAAYRKTVEEVIGEWRAMFGSLGIGYEVISTDAPFGVPLARVAAASSSMSDARPPSSGRTARLSFLAPLYLLLGGAIAVPLLLHLDAPAHRRARGVSRRALSGARREGAQSHAARLEISY